MVPTHFTCLFSPHNRGHTCGWLLLIYQWKSNCLLKIPFSWRGGKRLRLTGSLTLRSATSPAFSIIISIYGFTTSLLVPLHLFLLLAQSLYHTSRSCHSRIQQQLPLVGITPCSSNPDYSSSTTGCFTSQSSSDSATAQPTTPQNTLSSRQQCYFFQFLRQSINDSIKNNPHPSVYVSLQTY